MIKGVIFDWAGTTVDFGCFAPVEVFLRIFEEEGVTVTFEEARKPMGMLKIDHIRTMLEMPRITAKWQEVKGATYNDDDINRMYASFEKQLMATLADYTDPIEGVVDVVNELRAKGIKIGSTTGYTSMMMDVVKVEAEKKGYAPDELVTADQVGGKGRPFPYMLFENMRRLQLTSVNEVVKVGDTTSDVLEGVNAGVFTIGVIVGSSEMGLSEEDYAALTADERTAKIAETKTKFETAGAHATIETMKDLPALLATL